jgi:hypothetical protein
LVADFLSLLDGRIPKVYPLFWHFRNGLQAADVPEATYARASDVRDIR